MLCVGWQEDGDGNEAEGELEDEVSEWHRVGAVLELGSGLRSRLGLGLGLDYSTVTITITGLLLGGPHRS